MFPVILNLIGNCTWCNDTEVLLSINSTGEAVCHTCLHINCDGEPCQECRAKDAAFAMMVEEDQHKRTAAMLNKSHLRSAA